MASDLSRLKRVLTGTTRNTSAGLKIRQNEDLRKLALDGLDGGGGAAGLALMARAQENTAVIDDCRYADDTAAAGARGSPCQAPPARARLFSKEPKSCAFRAVLPGRKSSAPRGIAKSNWTLAVPRVSSSGSSACDASPVSHFSLYFQSGEGWDRRVLPKELPGWNTITIHKAATSVEYLLAGARYGPLASPPARRGNRHRDVPC